MDQGDIVEQGTHEELLKRTVHMQNCIIHNLKKTNKRNKLT